eukprot:gene7205-7971_t
MVGANDEVKTSRITVYGENVSECGYCGRATASSRSFGFTAQRLAVRDYEVLMLRGWRRSGAYFYKPIMHKTCCPAYTIRLPVQQFQPSRAQKKVLRKAPPTTATDPNPSLGEETRETMSIVTEPASFSEEKFDLYRRYQVAVHKDKEDEVTREGFTRFLIDSPLLHSVEGDKDLGTFHQCYRLQGRLVAVGVVDLLPSGLSSVYCFYDPALRSIALGKYTALKEIDYCRDHGYEYYYMGFYIQSCPKMAYKAEYSPSQLLCPASLSWHPIENCQPLLERFAFTPLEPGLASRRELLGANASPQDLEAFLPSVPDANLVDTLSLFAESIGHFHLSDLTKRGQDSLRGVLCEFLSLVGADIAAHFLITF